MKNKLFLFAVFIISAIMHAQDRGGVQVTQPSVRITSPKIIISGPDVVIGPDTRSERPRRTTCDAHYHTHNCCHTHHDNGKHKGHYKHNCNPKHNGHKKHKCHK